MGDMPLMTQERHLHHQRHRARHRLADAPPPGRVLRPRQGQDPFLGQVSVRRPRHPLSRLVARFRVRRQGPRLCPHRPAPQAAGDDAALWRSTARPTEKLRAEREADGKSLQPARGAGHGEGGNPRLLLQPDRLHAAAKHKGWKTPFDPERYHGRKLTHDLDRRQDRARCGSRPASKLTPRQAAQAAPRTGLTEILVAPRGADRPLSRPRPRSTKRPARSIAEAGDEITEALLDRRSRPGDHRAAGARASITSPVGPYIRNTLPIDKNATREDALIDIYRVMRPGEPPTLETAETLFNSLFFDGERYDLSAVGRVKMNSRLELRRPRTRFARCARKTSSPSSRCWSSSRTAAARSTTSTISATAACARSAS